jgi:hypothetical protein
MATFQTSLQPNDIPESSRQGGPVNKECNSTTVQLLTGWRPPFSASLGISLRWISPGELPRPSHRSLLPASGFEVATGYVLGRVERRSMGGLFVEVEEIHLQLGEVAGHSERDAF